MQMASEKVLKKLEFDKILHKLAHLTSSPIGRNKALNLRPVGDYEKVFRYQAETAEACDILRLETAADFGGDYPLWEALSKAERGVVLDGETLWQAREALRAARVQKKFLLDRGTRYPLLTAKIKGLEVFPHIEQELVKCLLPGGEVSDSASHRLREIRQRLNSARVSVRERLGRIVRSSEKQKYLQEAIVTIRENRYVIPVRIEHQNQVPGLVHDQSSSGATLFIEPLAVVEKNNEIRQLEAAETIEIHKVLARLTESLGQIAAPLRWALEVMGDLDFIMAKAHLSKQLAGVPPEINQGAFLHFQQARHPLIKEGVVPIDGHLGQEFDLLVLTGPNAGGKTVALKTFGLLVLMAQAGLHVPATFCEIGVFGSLFADIGDEQSIENSLSTFSGHMESLVEIVHRVHEDSLVLIDELGTGTDPTEGAALAQAILSELADKKVRAVATTHFGAIKEFAVQRERVENASMEFDLHTLQPTFKLVIGQPGRSYAFEIASRLGMPSPLIHKARNYLSSAEQQSMSLLKQLEEKQQEAEKLHSKTQSDLQDAAKLRKRYAAELEALKSSKKNLREKAAKQIQEILRQTKREAEEVIQELRVVIDDTDNRTREQAIQKARARMRSLGNGFQQEEETLVGEKPKDLQENECVYLPRYKQQGITLAASQEGKVLVQVGALKLTVPLEEVRRSKRVEPGASKTFHHVETQHKLKMELDLRGLRAEEALEKLDQYLDRAQLSSLSKAYIIHGLGTGVLREVVQEFLKNDNRVKSYRFGEKGEGGLGVTVVEL